MEQFCISFSRIPFFFFADFSFLCPQEDHGGEVDDNDDLELVKERAGTRGGRKDDYF